MNKNSTNLVDFISDELFFELSPWDINTRSVAEDLADTLISNGYCSDPYSSYDKALTCPINKRREKYCSCTQCESYEFCELLRKEGYINV